MDCDSHTYPGSSFDTSDEIFLIEHTKSILPWLSLLEKKSDSVSSVHPWMGLLPRCFFLS